MHSSAYTRRSTGAPHVGNERRRRHLAALGGPAGPGSARAGGRVAAGNEPDSALAAPSAFLPPCISVHTCRPSVETDPAVRRLLVPCVHRQPLFTAILSPDGADVPPLEKANSLRKKLGLRRRAGRCVKNGVTFTSRWADTGRPASSVPFPDLVRARRTTWVPHPCALPVTYFKQILRGKV